MKRINEATLTAYLDGELTQAEQEWVESRLAESANLQVTLAQLRREKSQVEQGLDILAPSLRQTATVPKHSFSKNGPTPSDLMVWESPGFWAVTANTVGKALGNWRFYLQTTAAIGLIIIGVSLVRMWVESSSEVERAGTPAAVVPIAPAPPILFTAFIGEMGTPPTALGLYTVQPDGSNITFLQEIGASDSGGPVLSPDGQKIAYFEQSDIYIVGRDGLNPVNITNSPDLTESFPAWSPDGQRLLFGTSKGLEIVEADGSNRIQLVETGATYHQVWSPDGQQVAFIAQLEGGVDLYLINADGTGLVNLTQDANREMYPTWSADGQRLAFISEMVLNIITVDSTNLTSVLNDNPDEMLLSISQLAWSPNGERLVFIATPIRPEPGQYSMLFTVKPDGSDLTTLSQPESRVIAFAWSLDGQRLVYTAGNGQGNGLYVIKADGTGRTRLTDDTLQAVQHVSWGNP